MEKWHALDVDDPTAVRHLIEKLEASRHKIDVLVNNVPVTLSLGPWSNSRTRSATDRWKQFYGAFDRPWKASRPHTDQV